MNPYHVTLGGEGFLVDLASYTVRALGQVPAEAVLGGRGPSATDPFYQRVQRQRGFERGEGYARLEDPPRTAPFGAGGWRRGHGVVAVARGGGLRLGPALGDSGAGPVFGQGVRAFAVFRGRLYAGLESTPGEVWSFDGAAWSLAFTTGKPGIRALCVYRDALYVGNGGDGVVQRWDGATLATAWTNASVASIDALCVAWTDGSARLFLGNTSAVGSGWLQSFDGVAQSVVGVLEEPRVEALAVADGRLYLCASDPLGQARGALYAYAGASAGLEPQRGGAGDGYAVAACALDRQLVLGWSSGGRLLAWDPSKRALADLARPPLPDGWPLGSVRALLSFGGALWAGFRDPATGALGARRFDPSSEAWSVAAVGASGDEALALGAYGGALYLGVRQTAGSAQAFRLDLSTDALAGEIETSEFDGGFPDLEKALRALELRHAPLPAGSSLAVEYRLDPGGAWQSLGSAATAGGERSTLPFPAGSVARTVAFRIGLTRGPGASDSPELREVALRSVLVPTPLRQWDLAVLLEGDGAQPLRRLDNTPEPRTARELSAALWALRATPGPLAFEDLEGVTRQVWLRELKEAPQPTTRLDATAARWTVAHLTLVEA